MYIRIQYQTVRRREPCSLPRRLLRHRGPDSRKGYGGDPLDGSWHPPGEFAGIPPTGSRVTAIGIEFDRIVGGKIDEAWVSYHLFADSVHDPERVKRAFAAMHHTLPDLHVAQADSITEGDKIAFRWAMSGTHEGEFMGIAPTGKLVMAMGIDIVRVVDDEILDYWGEFDVMGCCGS